MSNLILVLFVFACGAKKENVVSMRDDLQFDGQWVYLHNDDRTDYTLSLKVNGTELTGTHCFVAMSGERIDCPEKEQVTISGKLRSSMFKCRFNSQYTGEQYSLEMKLVSDTLRWSINEGKG